MIWKTLILLSILLAGPASIPADGAPPVDHCYSPVNVRTPIGIKDGPRNPVVLNDGSLLINGYSLEAEPVGIDGSDSVPRVTWKQYLVDGYLPIVQTQAEIQDLQIRKTSFTLPTKNTPCDVMRIEVLNASDKERSVEWSLQFGSMDARVTDVGLVLEATTGIRAYVPRRWGYRVSGCELRSRPKALGYVGHHHVESTSVDIPDGVADVFRRAAVGPNGTPIRFRFPAEGDTKYTVILGLCEGYWEKPGRRLLNLRVEGDSALTVDPVEISGKNRPTILQFLGQDENRDGWIDISSTANRKSPDQKAILNAIWVLDLEAQSDAIGTTLITGSSSDSILFRSDCGNPNVERAGGSDGIVHTSIPPDGWASFFAVIPWDGNDLTAEMSSNPSGLLNDTRSWWWPFLDESVDISVPDRVVVEFYRSCLTQLFLSGNPGATPYYSEMHSLADACLHIHEETMRCAALSMSGYSWAARQYLEHLIQTYENTEWSGTRFRWLGAGRIIWALWLEMRLSKSDQYLMTVYPTIVNLCDRIVQCRNRESEVTSNQQAPPEGILPLPSSENEQNLDYYFGENIWSLIGLRLASEMAEEIGERFDARQWRNEHRRYRRDLEDSMEEAFVKEQGYLPASTAGGTGHCLWDIFEAVYPVKEFPDVEEIPATLRWLEQRYQNGVPTAVGVHRNRSYLSVCPQVAGSYLALNDSDKVPKMFYAFMNHASRTKTWSEIVSPEDRIGSGDIPDIRAVSGYVLLLRNMILWENDDQLHLAPATERSWLYPGCTISVVDAPSLYGLITFNLQRISPETLLGTLIVPDQEKHVDVHVHLRLPKESRVREVILNGHRVPLRDGGIVFPSSGGIYDIHADITSNHLDEK